MSQLKPLVCVFTLLLSTGCSAALPAWSMDWHAKRYRDHPLVGRIWQPQTQSWASPEELRTAVAKARFVVLGETHDNPDHHRLQAQLLKAIVRAGRRPVVAFEMLDLTQQQALAEFLEGESDDAAALGPAVGWADTGWPAWSMYAPIAEVALANDLKIVAANLPADKVKAVAVKGYDALEPGRVEALGLHKPWPESRRETLRQVLYVGHCKLVPKSALTGMMHAQRARNAIMAERMIATAGSGGAVLITGAGHARQDFGVPLNLRHGAPEASIVSIAFIEVRPSKHKPAAYAARFSVPRLPFDYVLFTPAAKRKDPCERLAEQFADPGAEGSG